MEAEKEDGIYEAAKKSESGFEIADEHSARKSRQAVAMRSNHLPLKVVQVGRKHIEGLGSKLIHKIFLDQKRALIRNFLLTMSLRKRENWSQPLPYVIRISVIKILQFQ